MKRSLRSRWPFSSWVGAMTALWLTTSAQLAWAQPSEPESLDEEKGRELATEAMGSYKEGDYAAALDKFAQAREVYPTGQVLRMQGYSLLAMQRWREAAEVLDAALATEYKPLSPPDAAHAKEQLDKALAHIATVTVSSSVEGASVRVDGGEARELPAKLRLDPGAHSFVVSAEGYEDAEEEQDLTAGQKVTLALDPRRRKAQPAGPPAPKPRPAPTEPPDSGGDAFGWFPGQGPIGLAAAGVGLAAAGVGLGLGLYGLSLRSAVEENIAIHNQRYDPGCRRYGDLCRADITLINRDGERAADLQNAGMVTGIAGAGLVAVGVTLFLLSDDSPLAPDEGSSDQAGSAIRSSLRCAPLLGLGLPGGERSPHGLACGARF